MQTIGWPTNADGSPKMLSQLTGPERTRALEVATMRVAHKLPPGASHNDIRGAAWLTMLLRNAHYRASWTLARASK